MIINYTIEKEHGNFRPKLTIKILKEKWEKKLNPESQYIKITVPHNFGYKRPYPVTEENTENKLTDVSISTDETEKTIYLPYRPGKNPTYPEIEQALNELHKKYEAAVLEAYQAIAFTRTDLIEPSKEFKKKIAPWVAKQKMLKGIENEQ